MIATKEIEKLAIDDYISSKKSLSDVAKVYGFTGGWLRKKLISNGIKPRGKSEWKVIEVNEYNACKDYKDGVGVKVLAKKYEVCRRTISDWLKKNNIKPLKNSDRLGITNDMKISARKMYQDEKLNCVEIAKLLGVSARSIFDWIRDIKRTRSEISCILSYKGKKKNYGKKGSIITKFGLIRYDSSYERDRINQLCNDENIISLNRCPYFIKYNNSNYNPDFIIEYKCGCICIEEVKPLYMLTNEINIKKFESAKTFCIQKNILFSIITEKEIYGK